MSAALITDFTQFQPFKFEAAFFEKRLTDPVLSGIWNISGVADTNFHLRNV